MNVLRDEEIDKLIDEVEKRPPLYLKSLKEYSDSNLKKKLWEEVFTIVAQNWTGLPPEEKQSLGKCIYTLIVS